MRVRQVEYFGAKLEPLVAETAEALEHGQIEPFEIGTPHLRGIASQRREIRLADRRGDRRIWNAAGLSHPWKLRSSRDSGSPVSTALQPCPVVVAVLHGMVNGGPLGIREDGVDAPTADQLIDEACRVAAKPVTRTNGLIVARAGADDVRRVGIAQRPVWSEQPQGPVVPDVVDQPLAALGAALREGVVRARAKPYEPADRTRRRGE